MEFVCKKCNQPKTAKQMDVGRGGRPNQSTCRSCRYKRQTQWKRNHPGISLAQWARQRARAERLPCDISHKDLEVPEICPAIGIRLEKGVGKLQDASPSLDRIIPALGYVKGNVRVISYKANRMKNNATLSELKALVRWLESV